MRQAALVPFVTLIMFALLVSSHVFTPTAQAQDTTDPASSGRIAQDLLELANRPTGPDAPESGSAAGSDTPESPFIFSEDGSAVGVRITAQDVDALRPRLQQLGFQEIGAFPNYHFLEGTLPIDQILNLETLVGDGLMGVMGVYRPLTDTGSVTSEADIVLETQRVRDLAPGYDGTGVKICAMSDSFNRIGNITPSIQFNDLPNDGVNATVDVLDDSATGTLIDEGRAMLELIHDLAPGATLGFATAFNSESTFATNIGRLANPADGNCDVIVDDVVFFTEPFFQDGIVAQAVDAAVTNNGVAYFSSAGNRDTRAYDSGDSYGTTPLNFASDSGGVYAAGRQFYDFDTGAGVDTRQSITLLNNESVQLSLQWDDPFFTLTGVDTDIRIVVVNAGTATERTTPSLDNTDPLNNIFVQFPAELVGYQNTSGATENLEIMIELVAGPIPQRMKYVNFGSDIAINEFDTNSPTVNPHAAAVNGQAIAAAPYFDQRTPESFTSRGPSTFLFNANGTRKITPEVRQTPDYTATDGTNNTFFGADAEGDGNPNFFGTSAAAPHAAAVAALVLQANPTFTPAQVYAALSSSAEDIITPGFDNVTGAGLINAFTAIYGPPTSINLPNPTPTFSEDFETGALNTFWELNSFTTGRILLRNPDGSSTINLTMDTFIPSINSLNEAILHLDLRNSSNVVLSFNVREFGDETNLMPSTFTGSTNADGVALSVDGTNWFALPVSVDSATFQTQTVNLSNFATTNGLSLDNADVQIKFQQFDNFPIALVDPSDGIVFDNIQVTSDTPTNITLVSFTAQSASGQLAVLLPVLFGVILLVAAATLVALGRRRAPARKASR